MDAERATLNELLPQGVIDPVEIVVNANGVLSNSLSRGRTGVVTKIELVTAGGTETLFDRALSAGDAAYPDPNRLVHVATSF